LRLIRLLDLPLRFEMHAKKANLHRVGEFDCRVEKIGRASCRERVYCTV
jgi:hypothetical protein